MRIQRSPQHFRKHRVHGSRGFLDFPSRGLSVGPENCRRPLMSRSGGRGGGFCNGAADVCDPDKKRLVAAAKRAGVDESHAVTDMRRILDNQSTDAVIAARTQAPPPPGARLLGRESGRHFQPPPLRQIKPAAYISSSGNRGAQLLHEQPGRWGGDRGGKASLCAPILGIVEFA